MTKSSVNFKALKSALHAVSHATRTVEPSYLLAKDKSMGTIVLLDDKGSIASTLEAKLSLASRQALREKNYSPLWEGILNLPRPEVGFDADAYKKTCSSIVSSWYKSYEASTGHKVLRVDVHLDEGHMVDGEAVLNAHAHVIADRTNDKGRVMQLSPKMLRELQTLTAKVTGLERGKSSLETGRKHISHQAYKYLAELGRLETQKQVDVEKSTTKMYGGLVDTLNYRSKEQVQQLKEAKEKTENLQAKLDGEPARLAAALKAQEAQLNEQYRSDREALKASGEAEQADYQALKKAHEELLATLKKPKKEKKNDTRQHPKFAQEPTGILEMQDVFGCDNVHDLQHFEDLLQQDAPGHLRPVQTPADHPELQQLDPPGRPQVDLLQEALADNVALKKTHEKALADLTKAQTEAGKVSGLEVQIDQLTPQAAKVPGLEKQVTDARQDTSNKAAEIARINTRYQLDREEFKRLNAEAAAAGLEKVKSQKDYQDLKKERDDALAKIAQLENKVSELTGYTGKLEAAMVAAGERSQALTEKLAEAQTKAAKVPQLEAKAVQAQAQIDQLTPVAEQVPRLELSLKTTAEQVKKMDEYTKTLNAKVAQSNEKIATELVAKAKAIEALVQSGEKSAALLVTAEGHRAAAEKLSTTVTDLTQTAAQRLEQIVELGKAMAGATEKLAVSEEKLGKLEVRHEAFKVKANEKLQESSPRQTKNWAR